MSLDTQNSVSYLSMNYRIINSKYVASRNSNSCDLPTDFNNASKLCNELVPCWGTLMEGSYITGTTK